MNVYERQLRAGIAGLMAAAPSLATRNAQIQGLGALLNIHDVATLLAILDEERSRTQDTNGFNAGVQAAVACIKSIDDGEAPEYAHCRQEVEALMLSSVPAPAPAAAEQPPIPVGVYYDGVAYRFREIGTAKDMGYDFYTRWQARALEFPTAPVNPASKREIQPGRPGFNAGDKREGSV